MEKRPHYNKQIDDLTKIDEFFQKYNILTPEEKLMTQEIQESQDTLKVPKTF